MRHDRDLDEARQGRVRSGARRWVPPASVALEQRHHLGHEVAAGTGSGEAIFPSRSTNGVSTLSEYRGEVIVLAFFFRARTSG